MSEENPKAHVTMTQVSSAMEPIAADAFALTELTAGGSLLEQDAIVKMNAGAMLTFAVWSLPKDVALDLFKNAPLAAAYGAAFKAYGLGGH